MQFAAMQQSLAAVNPDLISPPPGSGTQRRAERLADAAPGDDEDPQTPPELSLTGISPPIDLSVMGVDGGPIDEITFSRFYRSRGARDALAGGVRRVRYYVQDGVLYREESLPYGFRPGNDLMEHFELMPDQGDVARLFYGPGFEPPPPPAPEDEAFATLQTYEPTLPDTESVSEPLCEGVEIFDIAYGYNRFEQWNEASDWDSNAFRYRFPEGAAPGDLFMSAGISRPPGATFAPVGAPTPPTETVFNPNALHPPQMALVNGQPIRFTPQPDNLPGYIAIQLGLRDPVEGGRLRSFTIFVSLPMAREEFDTTAIEDVEQPGFARPAPYIPSDPAGALFSRSGGGIR
jgi:hypothetical protein